VGNVLAAVVVVASASAFHVSLLEAQDRLAYALAVGLVSTC